jgi:hypothetical protein
LLGRYQGSDGAGRPGAATSGYGSEPISIVGKRAALSTRFFIDTASYPLHHDAVGGFEGGWEMAQSTFGRRTIKIVRRGAIAIICLHAGLGVAQEMESLSLSDGVSGHARPVSPSRIPPAGSGPEHQVIPVLPHPFGGTPAQKDTVLQTTQTNQTTLSGTGFNGIGISSGYAVQYIPPDTSGAAGDTQYVQFVNAAYAVLDKQTGYF